MRQFLLLLLCILGVLSIRNHRSRSYRGPPEDGETYALLVAGSNGWYNYRHQADIGHAYHTLIEHGIPADNIIVMMYDDVAHNILNPFLGKLYNKPHGKDVYKGLKIDYRGKTVTPKNFLNVLMGKADEINGGNGRVIDSTKNDRIFVYFTDHGATGLIAFPDEMLTVKQLNDGLKWMAKNEKYSQLVFYLEACESGSMFEDVLAEDLNIYAITAANGHESSWGTYCDNDMNLPCLGDLFSVNWMNDSDEEDLDVETLNQQFDLVKKLTNQSHVMHFGDLSIAKEPVGWFQGEKSKNGGYGRKAAPIGDKSSWPARDIQLMYLHKQKDESNDVHEQKAINQQIREIHEDRRNIKNIFLNLIHSLLETSSDRRRMLEERNVVENLACHHQVTLAFDRYCIDFNKYDYALRYAYVLNNLCIEFGDSDVIMDQILLGCTEDNML